MSQQIRILNASRFKNAEDLTYFENWVSKLETANNKKYAHISVNTSLGKTQVYALNHDIPGLETLVIFPGARTTALIWDFDNGLNELNQKLKIYLVETNGLPNLSDGNSPDIKSLEYGMWANEVLVGLNIEKTYIAGASFGGLICMKLAIVNPEKIKAAFLLNPGCLQTFSLSFKNLYYNILPIVKPTEKNVQLFLEKAVFSKPNHRLSPFAEKMLIDYEVFALKQYLDKTQKPYFMGNQLKENTVPTYLLLGDRDLLFPYKKSISNAKKLLSTLKEIEIFPEVGHGIETYAKAINYIGNTISKLNSSQQ